MVAILTILGCFLCNEVRADELLLKNGHILRGRVLAENDNQVILQVPEGKMWIRKSRISTILKLNPRGTLIEECKRRIEGGTPGSAIPFLRTEYRDSIQKHNILNIYRECLLSEAEKFLDQNKLDQAMELWIEYDSLPGSSPRESMIREKIHRGESQLIKLENEIHLALEFNQPFEATHKIKKLLEEYPAEHLKWDRTLSENLLEAGRRFHDSGDLNTAATLLIEAVTRAPDFLPRARTAIVNCSTSGQGITTDQATQLLPDEPAIYLAAAKAAEISGNGTERAVHLNKVRGKVGLEISPIQIRNDLANRASLELAGAPVSPPDLDLQIEQHLDRFWYEWNLPGRPPRKLEVCLHDNSEQTDDLFGSGSDSALLVVDRYYGRTISETIHLIPDAPFLDQDDLPREMFRYILPKIVGSHRWLPAWLEEGLCSIARGHLARMRDQQLLEQAHRMGDLPQITHLLELTGPIDDELYRASCGSLVDWLISDVPPALLPSLLSRITEEGLEQSLSVVAGADTLHQLQQDWIQGKITGH
ncbi:MAG: hypothetical protein VX764_05305 [Planctomycetota bacterium]|nr:hypothetical protein [Planctomycetota bacterium]